MDWVALYQHYVSGIKPGENGWYEGFCPVHEDPETSKTPSFGFHENGGFKCHGCGFSGNAYEFFSTVELNAPYDKNDREQSKRIKHLIQEKFPSLGSLPVSDYNEKSKSKKVEPADLPSLDKIDKWQNNLLTNFDVLGVLEHRGISIDTISEFRIGYDESRRKVTIPIFSHGGLVNVRFWSLDKDVSPKFQGVKGWNQNRLYPDWDGSLGEVVWLVEGEPDCLMARSLGLNAFTFTCGATAKPSQMDLEKFKDKSVVVIYDCDDAGRLGAKKIASVLRPFTRKIKIVDLLKVGSATERDDLTDVFIKIGSGLVDEVKKVLKDTTVDEPAVDNKAVLNTAGFGDSIQSSYIGRLIEIKGMVSGRVERPFNSFEKISAVCHNVGDNTACPFCPLMLTGKKTIDRVEPRDLLRQIRVTDKRNHQVLTEIVGAQCPAWKIDEDESVRASLYEVSIGPGDESALDCAHSATGFQQRTAWLVDNGTTGPKINQSYTMVGQTVTNPVDQSNTQVFTNVEELVRPTDQFVLTDEIKKVVKGFQIS